MKSNVGVGCWHVAGMGCGCGMLKWDVGMGRWCGMLVWKAGVGCWHGVPVWGARVGCYQPGNCMSEWSRGALKGSDDIERESVKDGGATAGAASGKIASIMATESPPRTGEAGVETRATE